MRLKEPQGGARKADKIWPLSAIWRMGRLTLGIIKSHSPPFSSSHSRVEKPRARTCRETMPQPAKNYVKNLPVTRTGGDCWLTDGRGRWPRHEAPRPLSRPGASRCTGRRLVRAARPSCVGRLFGLTSTAPFFESPAPTASALRGRCWHRCADNGTAPLMRLDAPTSSGTPAQTSGR